MEKIDSTPVSDKAKAKYQVTTRPAYNAGLKQRGSLTLWISEDVAASWKHVGEAQRGGQFEGFWSYGVHPHNGTRYIPSVAISAKAPCTVSLSSGYVTPYHWLSLDSTVQRTFPLLISVFTTFGM